MSGPGFTAVMAQARANAGHPSLAKISQLLDERYSEAEVRRALHGQSTWPVTCEVAGALRADMSRVEAEWSDSGVRFDFEYTVTDEDTGVIDRMSVEVDDS